MNAGPWLEIESGIAALVDKLGGLELALANVADSRLTPERIRAATHLISKAFREARAIQVGLRNQRPNAADPAAERGAALLARKPEGEDLRTDIMTLGAHTAAIGTAGDPSGAAPEGRANHLSVQAARDLMAEIRTDIATLQARTIAVPCFDAALNEHETDDGRSELLPQGPDPKRLAWTASDLLAQHGAGP